ncbi:MAG: hypothetical protein AAB691_02410 [Patescibacteria group bacterium]
MRSIPFILFLAACSADYNIIPEKVTEPAPSNVTDVPADEPETNNGDVDPEPTDTTATEQPNEGEDNSDEPVFSTECGFTVVQGWNMPDVDTESLAIFSPVGDTDVVIQQGDTARYQIAVTALDCGGIDLNLTTITVSDFESDPYTGWLHQIGDDYDAMYLTDLTDGIVFDANSTNHQINPQQFFYTWKDAASNQGQELNSVNDNMMAVHVDAGTTKILEFDFTATDGAPVGTTFTIAFGVDVQWTDEVTGQMLWDWHGWEGTEVNYEVVE